MPNLKAFLDMLAVSEGTATCPQTQDRGYDIEVNGKRFDDYSTHPFLVPGRKAVCVNRAKGLYSTAAGRYQILARVYLAYAKLLNLPDFSPDSQDKIAIRLITERHALDDIKAGNFTEAVKKCSTIWASLPWAQYDQPTHDLDHLITVYVQAGGVVG